LVVRPMLDVQHPLRSYRSQDKVTCDNPMVQNVTEP
jgi:hypothetical protein